MLTCLAGAIRRLLVAARSALLAALLVAKGGDCATECPSFDGTGGCCSGDND